MRIRQHIPDFVDGVRRATAEVETLEELLALSWVDRWAKSVGFVRFSESGYGDEVLLMGEFEDSFWVLGYMSESMGLPGWVSREKEDADMGTTASDHDRGLYKKFNVTRTDGGSELGGKHESCSYFVLDLDHDKHALKALDGYIKSLIKHDEYPDLKRDLIDIVGDMAIKKHSQD